MLTSDKMKFSVTLVCWACLLGTGATKLGDHGEYFGDSSKVTEQGTYGVAYRKVSVNLQNYFQNSTPMKIGNAMHHFFELKADPSRSQALQQVINAAFEMLYKHLQLTGSSKLAPEYRIGQKFADLVITPNVQSPNNIMVVEYKYISSQDDEYFAQKVLPNAEDQVKEYAARLVRRGFTVNGMYIVAARQLENEVMVILYGVD